MRLRLLVAAGMVVTALLALSGPAGAFVESAGEPWGVTTTISALDCNNPFCHGTAFATPGPHTNFSSTTDKCRACHEVHEAPSASKLLIGATITDVCHTCHDLSFTATGGRGVYGAIRARGSTATARHNVTGYNETESAPASGDKSYVATSVIPGGGTLIDDDGNTTTLLCTSCHTPHGNTSIAAFMGDRVRILGFARFSSRKILQDNPNGTPQGTYTEYGTQWCGVCHTRRHSANSAVNNHPTNNDPAFGYEDVTHTAGTGMGGTNAAYIMTPTPAGADGRVMNRQSPLCMQCHEDYRDVESAWVVANIDGNLGSDNPRWQTFPHETTSRYMTVETGDDLCMNCHPTTSLP